MEGLRGWFGSSIENMILLMEDILPNLLKKCKSLDIYSLARNELTGAGCPSRGGPIKMAEVAVPCVPSDRPIISELPILSISQQSGKYRYNVTYHFSDKVSCSTCSAKKTYEPSIT